MMKIQVEELFKDHFLIKKNYLVKEERVGHDISGPYWMLIHIQIQSGSIKWKTDDSFVSTAQKSFWIFVPKNSWISETYGEDTSILLKGIISESNLLSSIKRPVLFCTKHDFPKSKVDLVCFEDDTRKGVYIDLCSKPCALSQKVKQKITESIGQKIDLSEIAVQLGTSGSVVSRYFKRDFGQSPNLYKKGLRATIGMYSLLTGKKPEDAAARAGYQDLSRFYKQFKEYIGAPPSSHAIKSKNAKTKM